MTCDDLCILIQFVWEVSYTNQRFVERPGTWSFQACRPNKIYVLNAGHKQSCSIDFLHHRGFTMPCLEITTLGNNLLKTSCQTPMSFFFQREVCPSAPYDTIAPPRVASRWIHLRLDLAKTSQLCLRHVKASLSCWLAAFIWQWNTWYNMFE